MASGLAQSYAVNADRLAPRTAREHARRACADLTSEPQAEAVALVVSEIVTNAVRHGRGRIRVVLRVHEGEVFVAVLDQGPIFVAAPVVADPLAEGGRGLAIVDQTASSWGVLPLSPVSKLVWCVVDAQVRAGSGDWAGPGAAFLLGSSDRMDVPRDTKSTAVARRQATA